MHVYGAALLEAGIERLAFRAENVVSLVVQRVDRQCVGYMQESRGVCKLEQKTKRKIVGNQKL